jgi:spermidine synthase
MSRLNQIFLLYVVILIEGYVVLSSELIAMRQTIAYVGSGTDTVSIIIAAVLMPLALGYHSGGRFKQGKLLFRKLGPYMSIRKKLIFNVLVGGIILLPGMSFITIRYFFMFMDTLDISHRIFQTVIYSGLFIVIPVYLLGQTIPLVSNYFSKQKLSEVTGRMLCFSTIGSFLGAVFSTIVLMSTIGVNNTVSLNFILLAILVIILSKNKLSENVMYGLGLAGLALVLNSNAVMEHNLVVKSNKYNDLVVFVNPANGNRHLIMNGNDSSKYNDFRDKHEYVKFAERVTIDPIRSANPPKDILVVGAGAFTFGHEDENNNYVYVDLDGDLDEIAEKYILKEKIKKNKEFKVMDVRAYLRSTDKKFDVIFLDAYLGGLSIPESLVTRDFFIQIKEALKDKGILITNFIASPNFASVFSRSLDNTMRDVFPHVSRHVMNEDYLLWEQSDTAVANIAYMYRHEDNYDNGSIYTDDKNTVFLEKPRKMGK